MGKSIIKINQKFGRLTVLKRIDDYVTPKGKRSPKYLCKCSCGNHIEVLGRNLRDGNTKSCGCLKKEVARNKQKKHNTYNLSGKYGIGYTCNTNQPFYFDLEDYDKIKEYCWAEHHDGYIYTTDDNHCYVQMHCFVMNPDKKDIKIDHICTERKYDNQKGNLRIAKHIDNMCNRKLPTNNTSGVKGVYYSNYHHRWIADITREGKRIVRSFHKKEDAIKCRKNFENKLQNEFSYDNSQRKYKECLQ